LEDIFQRTLDLIPPAWQFPEITYVRIIFDNKEFKTSNFEETEWKLSTSIQILGKELNIEVYYLEDKPFLKEEESLIDDLGKRLKAIIEQKEAKKKLKESEEWLSTTLKSIGDGVITMDTNGNITFLNPVAESLSGWIQEDCIGHHINEIFIIINEFTRNPVENPALKAIQEGKPIGLANYTILITKNKKEIYIDDTGAPIKDKYGNVIGGILVFKDITNRRIAEQKLIESKHILSERVKELTCLYGLSNLAENINFSLEDIFQEILDLIPPAWQFPEITCARIIFDNKEFKTSNFEETEWKLSISTKLLEKELNIEVYYLEDKPFLKEEESLIDDLGKRLKTIIEQKESERKLKKAEVQIRTLMNNIPGMVYKGKPDWSIKYITNTESICGYAIDEFKSQKVNWFDIIHPDDKEKVENEVNLLIKRPMEVSQEYRIIAKNGSIRWVNDRKVSLFTEKGIFKGVDGIANDITERKKNEEKIIDLARFPSENPNPVLRVSKEFVIYTNQTGQNLFKVKPGSRNPYLLRDTINNVFVKNEKITLDVAINNRFYSLMVTPVKGTGYANIYGMDITTRKIADQKLQESENRLKSFMDSSTDGILLFDSQLNYLDVNKTVMQISGMNKEDFIGKNIIDYSPNVKESGRYDKYLEVLKTEIPFFTEDAIAGTSDRENLSIRAFKVGENLGMTFTDITQRKKAEQKLKESESNLKERVKELTCLHGLSNLINPDKSFEVIFQGALDLIQPAWQFPKITCARIIFDNKEFKTSNFEETEWKLSTSTKILGRELNIEVYYLEDKPFLKEEEDLIGDLENRLHTIIENKFVYEELNHSNREIQEAVNKLEKSQEDLKKFKTEFLATISHALRTPLNHVIGFTELLLEGGYGPLKQEQLDVLKDIKSSADDQLNNVTNVLIISDMEKGKFKLNFEEFSLKNSIDQIESDLKPLMDEKGLKFKFKGLKPGKKIFADPIRFKEILFKLLSNAIKFTIKGNITLIVQENRSNWTFSVKDTGIGIADEERDIIKEHIINKLVYLHKGEINIESELGNGSTFSFTIPKSLRNQESFA